MWEGQIESEWSFKMATVSPTMGQAKLITTRGEKSHMWIQRKDSSESDKSWSVWVQAMQKTAISHNWEQWMTTLEEDEEFGSPENAPFYKFTDSD